MMIRIELSKTSKKAHCSRIEIFVHNEAWLMVRFSKFFYLKILIRSCYVWNHQKNCHFHIYFCHKIEFSGSPLVLRSSNIQSLWPPPPTIMNSTPFERLSHSSSKKHCVMSHNASHFSQNQFENSIFLGFKWVPLADARGRECAL